MLYGMKREHLNGTGPAIVSVNGVIASLAVTEIMVYMTGLRRPHSIMTYLGHLGIVTARKDPAPMDCYYSTVSGTSASASMSIRGCRTVDTASTCMRRH